MTDFINDPDAQNLHFGRNEEKTQELQSQERYREFKQWLDDNGVINPSVEYPVCFGKSGQLVGMGALRDIPPMTAFLYIPQELLINRDNIRIRSPHIEKLFIDHPEVFIEHIDAEYLQLILFIMHEQMKGKDSFFYPYLQIVNRSDLPFLWEEGEIKEFQDAVLQSNIEFY